jgi:DNA-binding MarR family transcriptional regulator
MSVAKTAIYSYARRACMYWKKIMTKRPRSAKSERAKSKASRMTAAQIEQAARTLRLSDGVGFLVRIIDTRVRALYERLTRQDAITPRQFGILLTLNQRETLTLTELARHVSMDRSTLSEVIARMTKRKLISKTENGADARSAKVAITAEGKAVLLKLVEGALNQQRELMEPLTKSERARLVQNLKLLARYEE